MKNDGAPCYERGELLVYTAAQKNGAHAVLLSCVKPGDPIHEAGDPCRLTQNLKKHNAYSVTWLFFTVFHANIFLFFVLLRPSSSYLFLLSTYAFLL